MDIEWRKMSVYEVAKLGERFDIVLFMGVFYHLRHPLLALDLIREHVAGDLMLFQSMQRGTGAAGKIEPDYHIHDWDVFQREDFPRLFFVENAYCGDPTNWFIPNRAGMEAMLRSSGFSIEENPEREVYLCRKAERPSFVELPPC